MVQINSERPQDTRYVLYRAVNRIYKNGARSDAVYTIASGSVEITGIDPATDEETSRVLHMGITFGEHLLIDATRRIAIAVAVEDTKVLVLTRDEILSLLRVYPFFAHIWKPIYETRGLEASRQKIAIEV